MIKLNQATLDAFNVKFLDYLLQIRKLLAQSWNHLIAKTGLFFNTKIESYYRQHV
jgi:hypothetical protein